jgi:hypothetical protein
MLLVKLHPVSQVVQGCWVRQVVYEETEVRVLEIAGNETSEAFLSSRVPELQAI